MFAGTGLRVCSGGLTTHRCDDPEEDGEGTCVVRGNTNDNCATADACHGLDSFCIATVCAATGQVGEDCDDEGGSFPPCTRGLACESDKICRDSLFLPPAVLACDG